MSPTKKRSSSNRGIGTLIVLAGIVGIGLLATVFGSDLLGLTATPQPATATLISPPTITVAPPTLTATLAPPTATETLIPATATLEDIPPTPTDEPKVKIATETPLPEPVFVEAPVKSWWELYFVNPQRVRQAQEEEYGEKGIPPELLEGSIAAKLIENIDAAKTTIHIASFETDVIDVAKALIRAKERGVDVRWITDDEYGLEKDGEPGHGQFALLKKAGIDVIDDARSGLMHNKFWIFDNKVVWTGSTNITISGIFEQNNNTIVIESPELAAIYERQWEDMWAGKFNARSPSTVDLQKTTIKGTNIQVLFSPEDKAAAKIVPYLQNAKKSIYFMAFTFTQPDMGAALLDRAQNGVTVSGVFEKTGSDTEFSRMPPLFCAKVPVRQDGNFAFMHHKVFVIDERYVITGSLNFTDNASSTNNENVIIIDNPEIAKLYIEEFQRVWSVATDPLPDKIKCK